MRASSSIVPKASRVRTEVNNAYDAGMVSSIDVELSGSDRSLFPCVSSTGIPSHVGALCLSGSVHLLLVFATTEEKTWVREEKPGRYVEYWITTGLRMMRI